GPQVQELFRRDLTTACVGAIDSQFVNLITSGVPVATSTGNSAISARTDIANMVALIPRDLSSKMFIVTTPEICGNWALLGQTSTNGGDAFSDMEVTGGSIKGIQVVASDFISDGLVCLIDASRIAARTPT